MTDVVPTLRLTAAGAEKVMAAAIAKAGALGAPQCIAVVDAGGNLLAFTRMDGAKVHAVEASLNKALTAASHRARTGAMPPEVGAALAMATEGRFVNAKGGEPIAVDGHVVGAIGVGSGTAEEDLAVAVAGAAALGAK